MRAYIMVSVKLGRPETLARIKERTGFDGLEVFGSYDAVVEAEADGVEELHKKVMEIERMGLVRETVTYIVAHESRLKREDLPRTFAYVLVDALPGFLEEAFEEILKLDEVRKSDILFGPFDIIVDVGVSSMEELNHVVRNIINTDSVLRTWTLISFHRS